MTRIVVVVCAVALLLAGAERPVRGQGVQTVLHARRRVFPDVGRDASVIKRDAAGRYYVLAAPASLIWIYSPDGQRIGHIPSTQASNAAIKYAVDFDRDATGRVFVADRGANAVKIFTPEGTLEASVPVNAPMSVVALAGGEFAVVTLRSDHLVRVMNEHGKVVRSFGNVADAVSDPKLLITPGMGLAANAESPQGYTAGYQHGAPPVYAMDVGKLYSGAPGDIYFAFTALNDPKFRKYDRFGYSGYEADVAANELIPDINHDNSHVQLGMRVSGLAGPGEMFSFGTMYSVGGGAGFTMNTGRGAGGRHGGGAAGSGGAGGTGNSGGGGAAGSGGGASSADDSAIGGATPDASGSGDASNLSGSLSANSGAASGNPAGTEGLNALLSGEPVNGEFGIPAFFGPGGVPGIGLGGFGGPGGFERHSLDTGGEGGPSSGHDVATGGHGAGGGENPGAGHGEYGGERYGHGYQFREGLNSFSGVVRYTLPEADANASLEKPVIRALGVDAANQQVWAAVDDMLLHFDREGNLMDTYRVATSDGAALQPVGILVEPERILLVCDPMGIYEFNRPDKLAAPAKQFLKRQPPSAQ
ncbi:MAG: hypothetical protein WA192_13560 [Candidatus Acidiferrales bacterium]